MEFMLVWASASLPLIRLNTHCWRSEILNSQLPIRRIEGPLKRCFSGNRGEALRATPREPHVSAIGLASAEATPLHDFCRPAAAQRNQNVAVRSRSLTLVDVR